MKVAFASTDQVHVNEHFGQASEFYVWEISADVAEFAGVVPVPADPAVEEDRVGLRSAALKACAIVCVAEIGGPAAARLVVNKVHPIKVKGPEETIAGMVAKLQEVLRGTPPPWMRKAMLKHERPGAVETF
jgi:nitrogen fixation protein NifX